MIEVAGLVGGQASESSAPLDATTIVSGLAPGLRDNVCVDVKAETGSTNDDILGLPAGLRHGRVVLAERQAAGRGRRGRQWLSPPGNIWFSMGWRFSSPACDLEALGLVCAVGACRVLARTGLEGHGIKWPNDIQVDGAKLAGILVESRRRAAAIDAVVGIGINVDLRGAEASIDQPCADLCGLIGRGGVDRNPIVTGLIAELAEIFSSGPGEFASIVDREWPRWDLLAGKRVTVSAEHEAVHGEARGITPQGALKVAVEAPGGGAAEVRMFRSGEVSVRRD